MAADSPTFQPSTIRPLTKRLLIGLFLLALPMGLAGWWLYEPPRDRANRLYLQAIQLRHSGDYPAAEQLAAEAFALHPGNLDASLLAARCAAVQAHYERAIAHAQLVVDSAGVDPRRLEATLFIADLQHHTVHNLMAAEQAYRQGLECNPAAPEPRVGLINILGLAGRRWEAIPHILELIKLGVESDQLMLLARENGKISDDSLLTAASQKFPQDVNSLMGRALSLGDRGELAAAATLLRSAIDIAPDFAPVHVRLIQELSASERSQELAEALKQLPADADNFPATWMIRARLAEQQGNREGAIRCYWEAAKLSPESKEANLHLAQLLTAIQQSELASRFAERVELLQNLENVQNRVIFNTLRDGTEPFLELAIAYQEAGRLWEALGWGRIASSMQPTSSRTATFLQQAIKQVEGLPLTLTCPQANVALHHDLSHFPKPEFNLGPSDSHPSGTLPPPNFTFRDDSADTGFHFKYFNGVEGKTERKMYEFTGGGIGIGDFDADSFPDVMLTQGCQWPPSQPDPRHYDQLFRNLGGFRFQNCTSTALPPENSFGQGICVGDINADGFPDAYLASTAENQLLLNNGDGTFTNITTAAGISGSVWTTSCLVADLSGDGLPDLYDINYAAGADVFERVCPGEDGSPRACAPFHFQGEPDRYWLNLGNGQFQDVSQTMLIVDSGGLGLGGVAWDAMGDGNLCLFIANDTTNNFLYIPEQNTAGQLVLRDRGIETGVALSGDGRAQGCMGIAVGDVDQNGQQDLFVTNFYKEPNTLYNCLAPGYFEDTTHQYGLAAPALPMLGFGTQFLDIDLDGRLELIVLNGHVDDLSDLGRPWKMRPQLFWQQGQEFLELPGNVIAPYFETDSLGRGLALMDWNRDRRADFVAGHLDLNTLLLTNTTPQVGHSISLKLFGSLQNRDARGTSITARIGNLQMTQQLVAGSGYHASNEPLILIGTGHAPQLDELIIRWPTGQQQHVHNLPSSGNYLWREGNDLIPAPAVDTSK